MIASFARREGSRWWRQAGLRTCERTLNSQLCRRIAFPRGTRSGSDGFAGTLAYRCGGSAGLSPASRFTRCAKCAVEHLTTERAYGMSNAIDNTQRRRCTDSVDGLSRV